jgi:hypothetical protein
MIMLLGGKACRAVALGPWFEPSFLCFLTFAFHFLCFFPISVLIFFYIRFKYDRWVHLTNTDKCNSL